MDMTNNLRLALAGDAMITRRVSDCEHPDVRAILDLFRESDLAYANCEMLFHDYSDPEVFPAVEAGWSYMRAPKYIADDLHKLNFRLMSLATNHSFDYSYGGLYSTMAQLDRVGIGHAGAGRDLSQARSPAFADTRNLRVSLVSMTTSSTAASRAGMPHDGIPGRPGVNPLRFHFEAGPAEMEQILTVNKGLGNWIAKISDREWQINPPGLHNSISRYFLSDEPGYGIVLDESDVAANLRAIRNAKAYSDVVIVQVHNHEWSAELGTQYPNESFPPFARMAMDAGADIMMAQGGHAPFRGIEMYKGKPIFYDVGDVFAMVRTITKYPHDFYARHADLLDRPISECLVVDALEARAKYQNPMMINPPGGYRQDRQQTGYVPVLEYSPEGGLASIELHPFVHTHGIAGHIGMPFRPKPDQAREMIDHIQTLSRPWGTVIENSAGKGIVKL